MTRTGRALDANGSIGWHVPLFMRFGVRDGSSARIIRDTNGNRGTDIAG